MVYPQPGFGQISGEDFSHPGSGQTCEVGAPTPCLGETNGVGSALAQSQNTNATNSSSTFPSPHAPDSDHGAQTVQYGSDEEYEDTGRQIKVRHMRAPSHIKARQSKSRWAGKFKRGTEVTIVEPDNPWHHLTGKVRGVRNGRIMVILEEKFPFESLMGQWAYNCRHMGVLPDLVHRTAHLVTPAPEPQGIAVTLVDEGEEWHNQPGYLTGHLNGRALVTLVRSFPPDSHMGQWSENSKHCGVLPALVRVDSPPTAHTARQETPQLDTPHGGAQFEENINFDTAADVGITSNYGMLHNPKAIQHDVKGVGDALVTYTHEGQILIQPMADGPVVTIRALFKPGPALTLLPGQALGQHGWSFEGKDQLFHLKYEGEVQGTYPRAITMREGMVCPTDFLESLGATKGGTRLHSQFPLPDNVIVWPGMPPQAAVHKASEVDRQPRR